MPADRTNKGLHVLSVPAIFSLELTSACNNRCPGCSNVYAAGRDGAPCLSAPEWVSLLAPFIGEAVQIRLTGGEPTLHPQFFEILDYVTAHEAQVTVFTNGRWAHPEQFLHRIGGHQRLSGLLISLHGASAASHEAFSHVVGSYDETVANTRRAVTLGIPVALSCVLTCWSSDEIERMADLAQALGAEHVAFNRYVGAFLPEIEPDQEQLGVAVERIARLIANGARVTYGIGVPQCFMANVSDGCLAGVAYAAIDPWGRLRPCSHSPTVLGSLRQHSLAELWRGKAMEAWRGLMPAPCTVCAAYPACHGGCRAIQELRRDGRDPLRRSPLASYSPPAREVALPAAGRPHATVRLREEWFGYALFGSGQVMAVRPEARSVIDACTGDLTCEQLAARFGQTGLDLLGELWTAGMIELD